MTDVYTVPYLLLFLVKYQYTEDTLKGYLFSAYCYVKKWKVMVSCEVPQIIYYLNLLFLFLLA